MTFVLLECWSYQHEASESLAARIDQLKLAMMAAFNANPRSVDSVLAGRPENLLVLLHALSLLNQSQQHYLQAMDGLLDAHKDRVATKDKVTLDVSASIAAVLDCLQADEARWHTYVRACPPVGWCMMDLLSGLRGELSRDATSSNAADRQAP